MVKKENRKKRRMISKVSLFVVVLSIVSSAFAIVSIVSLGFIPDKYIYALSIALILYNLFFGFIGISNRINNLNKGFQIFICTVLSVLLFAGSIVLPEYKGKLERAFVKIPDITELKMNVYVLNESELNDISDLSGHLIGMQSLIDISNQEQAIKDINTYLAGIHGSIVEVKDDYSDIYSLTEALYHGDVEAILLSDRYAQIVADNEDFKNFFSDTKIVYQVTTQTVNEHDSTDGFIGNVSKDPFIVLVGGRDAGGERTDVNILIVVNPKKAKALMITIPRDTYIAIDGDTDKMDKLTHASVLGYDAWKNSVEWLLDYKIDFYATVGFESIIGIVDAIGGIDINNPYYFVSSQGNDRIGSFYYFYEGPLHLDGRKTLSYVRERKSIGGDEARNQHQAIVMKGLIEKVTSPAIISNIDSLLNTLNGMVITNFTTTEIYTLVKMQLDKNPKWSIDTFSMTGDGMNTYSYLLGYNSGPVWYMKVINDECMAEAKQKINGLLYN